MNLHIRDPRALELAQKLAEEKGVTVDEAVVSALEAQLEGKPETLADYGQRLAAKLREEGNRQRAALPGKLRKIADDLAKDAGPNGRDLTKDEIARMWGHE